MNRLFTVIMYASLICIGTKAQNTHYYKLTRQIINGVSSTNVSGGQFITFISDICYESNIKGVGVNNGKLTRNNNYSTDQYAVYQGTCFYGSNSEFKFNADKSVLNIILDNGDIYIYKRTTPPDGVVTCSLIKEARQDSDGSSGSDVQTVYVPVVTNPIAQPTPSTPAQSSQIETTPQKRWKNVTREVDCPKCHHSGKCSTCNGKGWYYNPYGSGTVKCPNCRNGWCTKCNGRGTITKVEQVYE